MELELLRYPPPRALLRFRACVLGLALALVPMPAPAGAEEVAPDLAAKLTPEQQRVYLAYRTARSQFEKEHRVYWSKVEAKREARKAKRILAQAYAAED